MDFEWDNDKELKNEKNIVFLFMKQGLFLVTH